MKLILTCFTAFCLYFDVFALLIITILTAFHWFMCLSLLNCQSIVLCMQEIVLALLQHGAGVRLINAEGNSAYNVAVTSDIKSLIEGNLYLSSAPSLHLVKKLSEYWVFLNAISDTFF